MEWSKKGHYKNMNKSLKGNNYEIIATKELNQKINYWKELNFDPRNSYAIHIIYKKYAKINQIKISAKADIFLAKGIVPFEYLVQKDYYLSEKDLIKFNLLPIKNSGISVKLPNSRYTITKISPTTFKKLFGDNNLAAGASIYCNKEKDFNKNIRVLEGWGINELEFLNYFNKQITLLNLSSLSDKKALETIKIFSNNKIAHIINNSQFLSDFIFKGIGNFEEPFTAKYLIENSKMKKNYYIPYKITTGSGRSNGNFTIVLKPK